jgi:hypothetical protein
LRGGDQFVQRCCRHLFPAIAISDRAAGYDWNLSIWRMEVSLTQTSDLPVAGGEFFEEIIRDSLDLGRSDQVQLIFERVVTKKTPGEFRTRVIQDGVHPSLHIDDKNFDWKQYFTEGRGCRTEGTLRNTNDFGANKGLSNLPYLQKIGQENQSALTDVQRVSHNSDLSGDSIQRVVQQTVTAEGEKARTLVRAHGMNTSRTFAYLHILHIRVRAAKPPRFLRKQKQI